MDQKTLYTLVKDSGFSVLVFEDHPGFFGNWRITVKRDHRIFEIVGDNREGWLLLLQLEGGQGKTLFEIESSKFSLEQELTTVSQWLTEVKNL